MEWIDVKERLPENNTSCIVWVTEYKYAEQPFFAEVTFNSDYFNVKDNRFVLYENGGEYEHDYTEGVTHWMIPTKPINIKLNG